MALGLLAYDVIFLTLAACLYGGAGMAAVQVFVFLTEKMGVPVGFAVFPAFLAFLFVLIVEVSFLTALCPRLTPGKYDMMKGAVFYGWLLRSALRRIMFVPGLKWFLFASNTLRFLTLRGLGAKVSFTTNMSADVELLDPSLVKVGPGAVLGARCLVSGHFVEDGKLVLGTIEVGKGSLLAADVICGPGVVIGEKVMVKAQAGIGLGTKIGDRASIGARAFLDSNVIVEAGAVVGNAEFVKPRTVVSAKTDKVES